MYLSEQYRMFQIAYHLVRMEGYHVLHINNEEEIWLEKYENKKSKVIRILHKGFDWKNHLKKDIAGVFHKIKAMDRLLMGKKVEIYNIYITSHSPVDDWEILKKPLQLSEKNPPKMQVYYLSEDNYQEELSKLSKDLGIRLEDNDENQTDIEKEENIDQFKNYLQQTLYEKNQERKELFSYGKPLITYFLLIINIIMFALLEIKGGSTNVENLIIFGAKYNPAIIDGEWWRLISSMFLHVGFLHLAMNMLALYYLGTAVERIFGSSRFILIYFLAGLGGSLTSFVFMSNVSAGASGAIFGLFGALLFFGVIHKRLFLQTMGRNVLSIVAINIVFGFVVPQIDISAHLGGLIAGFLAAAIVQLPKKGKITHQLYAFIAYIVISAGLVIFGLQNSVNQITYQLIKIEEYIATEDYEAVVGAVTDALEHPDQFEAELLFQRSIAYIKLNQDHAAIKDLEKSVSIKSDFSEAYYNLAILYYTADEIGKSEASIEEAYKLQPEDEAYKNLYEQIFKRDVE